MDDMNIHEGNHTYASTSLATSKDAVEATSQVPAQRQPTDSASLLERAATALRTRRAERAAERQLRRELACYDTPAAVQDLLAMAEHQDSKDSEIVRQILMQNLQTASRRGQ